uniref:FA complementation group B n=1 Tax=Oryzias latipes TaxID=8090 RepID=A0A3P9L6G7_ORYLA
MDIFDDSIACRLSHGGHLMGFICKRSRSETEGERTELLLRKLVFEPDRNRFVNAAQGSAVIGSKASASVNIVKCTCAVDVQRRVRTACVLVTRRTGKADAFKYSLLTVSSSDQLEPRVEFKLSYQMTDRVSILQGPTVMWIHDSCIFYTSLQAEGVRQIPISMSSCVFGELPLCKPQAFIIGQPEGGANNQPTSSTLAYLVGDGQVFDGTMILPHPYVGITESILVLQADRADAVLKCNLVAATSSKQLVYFENGIAKDACPLPFEQAEDIKVADLGRNGTLFVISFRRGNVCAVWKGTFQVASQWSCVSSVHIGDFLQCGTDQLLLVFDDQGVSEELKKHFLITDLCGIFYGGQDPDNSRLTLQALESRLQLRWTEGLIPLWDCDEESKEQTSTDDRTERPAVSAKPQIEKLWHRITGEQMVVGVTLTADYAVSKQVNSTHAHTFMPQKSEVQSVLFLPFPDEVKEDLLSLMVVLDRWVLHIDSPDYSLGDLDGWLQKKLSCKKIEAFSQYFLLEGPQPTTPMLLCWNQITPFQGQLIIHSCHLQMLQFLDLLLAFLPASCLIRPAKCTRGQRTAQMFAMALEKEVLALKEGLSELLCEEDEQAGHLVSSGPAEALQGRREQWQLDRERSRRRLSPLVEVGRFRNVMRSLSQVQMGSDLAAVLYTQKNLLS